MPYKMALTPWWSNLVTPIFLVSHHNPLSSALRLSKTLSPFPFVFTITFSIPHSLTSIASLPYIIAIYWIYWILGLGISPSSFFYLLFIPVSLAHWAQTWGHLRRFCSMDATAAAAAARGAALQLQTPPRKEWRAVAEHHHSARNPDDEVLICRRNTSHCLCFVARRVSTLVFEM